MFRYAISYSGNHQFYAGRVAKRDYMEVNVAGAGSGKTTLMSKIITSCFIPEGKVVFCIAFTNNAVKSIVDKVKDKLGVVPNNIRISTIHSFLYCQSQV